MNATMVMDRIMEIARERMLNSKERRKFRIVQGKNWMLIDGPDPDSRYYVRKREVSRKTYMAEVQGLYFGFFKQVRTEAKEMGFEKFMSTDESR